MHILVFILIVKTMKRKDTKLVVYLENHIVPNYRNYFSYPTRNV